MTWKQRARDILLAGGTLAAAGCFDQSSNNVPCGNADPDPCICGRPEADPESAALCSEQQACEAQGGIFDPETCANCGPNGTSTAPHCNLPDAGSADAGKADSGTEDASKKDASVGDATLTDTGAEDAATPDVSAADTGTADAGTEDAATPDVSAADTGTEDAETADAQGDGAAGD